MAMLANPRGWKIKEARARARHNDPERERIRRIRSEAIRAGLTDGTGGAQQAGSEPSDNDERANLIAELRAAGQFVPPKIKTETLRRKVEDLRNG